MSGKDCVAIGCDLRLGIQNQTLATDFKKVYKIHDRWVAAKALQNEPTFSSKPPPAMQMPCCALDVSRPIQRSTCHLHGGGWFA